MYRNRTDGPLPAKQLFEFTDPSTGDTWSLTIDARRQVGELRGSDLEDVSLQIVDSRIPASLIVSDAEYEWMARVWKIATGAELQRSAFGTLLHAFREFSADEQAPADGGNQA